MVDNTSDRQAAEPNKFEPADYHLTHFVRVLEAFEDHIGIRQQRGISAVFAPLELIVRISNCG